MAALYRLKRHWRNGTTHVIFEPLELVEKLAALVSVPEIQLGQVHGVLAPAAMWRPYVVPSTALPDSPGHPGCRAKSAGTVDLPS